MVQEKEQEGKRDDPLFFPKKNGAYYGRSQSSYRQNR